MKASEINPSQFIKALIYGESGSGKSCLAATFEGPIYWLDFDCKISSVVRYYKANKALLDSITVEQFPLYGPENAGVKMLKKLQELETLAKRNELPYKTVVLDTITTFSAICLQHIVNTNPGIKRVITAQGAQPGMQDYGILKREFTKIIPGLLSLPCNVVMLGHIKTDKDELSGELTRGCMMDGSFGQELPIYFEEVYRAYVDKDGKHKLQTKPSQKFSQIRSQIPGLPDPCDMNYSALIKHCL